MKNNVIVALDVPDLRDAKQLVKELVWAIRYFKVGKELFTSCGPEVVKMIRDLGGKVFLDLKYHDIPNTVAGSIRAACELGVFMVNVHASGGRKMLQAARDEVMKAKSKPLLIGVTVLTSMKQQDLSEISVNRSIDEQVVHLARLSQSAGLDGVVASGLEAPMIRKACGKEFKIVTPGVRPQWAATDDQQRILTPDQAFQNGADYIVIGRPITKAPNPLDAAKKVLEEIN
ncbi:MAG: orotidine-5'-phosphate decarboxylase [Candidatus Omnitrophica bacterium]|nr:orotidine-5'-phosphate decarboxylase [Candidatus Omnitrophota bacterium]